MSSVLIQEIVKPEDIESQLKKIWEKLAQENKMRACLFTLIVFNRYSERTDYIRKIVQKVVEKFPCRVLFVSEDPTSTHPYLKTAVSVIGREGSTACDNIDIGFAGKDIERVPYVLLPHIIPDTPVILLWTEDPSADHPLFAPFSKLADRLIFDSESADDLFAFSKTVLQLHDATGFDVADLNWARIEGWRDLLASLFHTQDGIETLGRIDQLRIVYNEKPTEFFCHLKIQSMYLLAWLGSRLHWSLKQSKELVFKLKSGAAVSIVSEQWEKLGPGTIIEVTLSTKNHETIQCRRIPEQYHHVNIEIASSEKCDLPTQFVLGKTATGHSLVTEICKKGTSPHYLEMLQFLQQLGMT